LSTRQLRGRGEVVEVFRVGEQVPTPQEP
jgi:hypothetical protein